jgi:O-antigen/teichoic acid export membrane protein
MTLAWNILTTLTARIALLALALISSVLLARLLGPEGRGLFALVLLLPGWARSVGLLGFEQANAVYAGLQPEKRRALVWQSAAIAGVVGGIVAVAGMGFFALEAPGSQVLVHGPLWLYLLPLSVVPAALATEYWGAILRGMNRILLLNVVEVGTRVASLVLIVIFVAWLRFDVAGAVWADTLITLGTVLLMGILLKSLGAWGKPSFDLPLWRRTARFAIPAHGGTIAAYLNYRIDEFIVAALLPPEQLGFYVIAVGLVERLWILPGSVATALLPHLANTPDRDPALPALISRHVMIWTGLACLVIFALADVVVKFLYSSAYAPTVAPLRWLLPGIFTLSIGKVLVAELLAQEKPRYTVWASSIAALVNIAGNLVLIPRMGISGAALASSISYSLLSLILIYYYLRETRMPWTALIPRRSDLLTYAALWRHSVLGGPVESGTTGPART